MVLWENVAGSMYKNLLPFEDFDNNERLKNMLDRIGIDNTVKSDQKSDELRINGNEQFGMKRWYSAMEIYSKSLRFATEGSENISLVYAN